MRYPRDRNTEENTPLQLFDEMEIHPLVISVETDTCPKMLPTIEQCLEKLGKPRNYGERFTRCGLARNFTSRELSRFANSVKR